MPHTRSAKKNMRKTEKRRANNRAVKRMLKTHVKRVLEAAEAGDVTKLAEEVKLAGKKFDKAAAKRVVHENLAARKKSQMARLLRTKTAAKAAPAKTAPSK